MWETGSWKLTTPRDLASISPFPNHSKHDITLPKRTTLDTIQHVVRILETDSPKSQHPESAQVGNAVAQNNNVTIPDQSTAEPWLPPVDLSDLSPEQRKCVEKVLREENEAFSHDSNDISSNGNQSQR